ncbi:MAG: flagellar hook-length control protein FliK [Stellaceae bacterium]
MTAQPVAMVPKTMKAPPAPMQGGHGFSAFTQFLGAADLKTPKGLAASTALATSLHGHKLHVKGARAAQDENSAADGTASAPDTSAAQALPLALSANPASAAPASADAASTPGASAPPLVESSRNRVILLANAASAAAVGIAAQAKPTGASTPANAKSFLGLIAAGSSVLSAATASSDAALSAAAAAGANAAGSAATPQSGGTTAPTVLNEATPTVTPTGSPQPHQAGPPATAFLVNQFGAPGATSANAPETSTQAAAPQKPAHDDFAASAAAPGTASNSTAAAANLTAMLPGAAALNARIVAGASAINDHPNQSAAPATAALTQPADPNAGTLPPSTSTGTGDDKGHDNSGFGLGSGSPAGIAAPAPSSSAIAASDPRAFAAALNHAGVQTDAAPSSGDGTNSQQDAGSDPTSASGPGLALPQIDPNAASNAPAPAPSDASLRPALIALPASEQVAINLKQALATDSDEIQIQLKPASLGTIDVKLNVNHDGRLTAVISADRSDTLNLLKQDASQLQQSLRDAGFNADSGSLSFNLRGDAQNFAQNAPPSFPASAGPSADFPAAAAAIRGQRQHTGTLDIHV